VVSVATIAKLEAQGIDCILGVGERWANRMPYFRFISSARSKAKFRRSIEHLICEMDQML
jgi:hypothetical protein